MDGGGGDGYGPGGPGGPGGTAAPPDAEEAALWAALRPPPPPPPARDCYLCPCGGAVSPQGVCAQCGALAEDAPGPCATPLAPPAHLHVRGGSGADALTRDMYRSGCAGTVRDRISATLKELTDKQALQASLNRGWRVLPQSTLLRAAQHYADVQQHGVVRADRKKSILGHCLLQACLEEAQATGAGIVLTKDEICTLMDMTAAHRGLALGVAVMTDLAAQGRTGMPVNQDTTLAEVASFLGLLGYYDRPGRAFGGLRQAAVAIARELGAQNIAVNSAARSRRAAVVWCTLCGWPDQGALAPLPAYADFCKKLVIRENTINGVLGTLRAYARLVDAIFARHGVRPPGKG